MIQNNSVNVLSRHLQKFYMSSLKAVSLKNAKWPLFTSIFLMLVISKANQILRPPKNLRHIPHLSFIGMLLSIIRKESYTSIARNKTIPMVKSPESNGFYLKPGGGHGWVINVSNPIALRTIFMKHEFFPKKDITTGYESSLTVKFVGVHNILVVGGDRSKEQRKVAVPAFRRSMPVKLFGRLTQDLFQVIDSTGDTVKFLDLMNRFALETIGLAGFGFKFNAIKDINSEWVVNFESIKNGLADPLHHIFPVLEKHFLWLFPKRREIHQNTDKFLAMLDRIIENKREDLRSGRVLNQDLDENEKDLLTLMMEAEEAGHGSMTNNELKSNLCLFFLAGHETSAISLTSVVYYLAKHPDIQQRARQEAIDVLGDEPSDVLPTIDQVKQLKYIEQIIKESLRLSVPTPQALPRVATEDTVLAGVHIPKGSLVCPNMHDVHHNDKRWENPFEFNPDRFDENNTNLKSVKDGLYWAPFGHGFRQCIGMDFNFYEQRVLLPMFLRKYIFSLPENSIHKDELQTEGALVVGPIKLEITFKKRY